jgi:hypothetical protein
MWLSSTASCHRPMVIRLGALVVGKSQQNNNSSKLAKNVHYAESSSYEIKVSRLMRVHQTVYGTHVNRAM